MQLPLEKKNLTVQEAADVLNVRRERIWKLLADGVLTSVPSKLDGRQKLIPREQVESLLLEEGYRPRRRVHRVRSRAPEHESGSGSAVPRDVDRELGEPSHGAHIEGQSPSESSAAVRDQANWAGTRQLPQTVGAVDDEDFQASESEAYMHARRDREISTAE